MTDHDLLYRYARENPQAAFAELVARHINLVYSTARRQVRATQLAEDITRSVFVDLARHAGDFPAANRSPPGSTSSLAAPPPTTPRKNA